MVSLANKCFLGLIILPSSTTGNRWSIGRPNASWASQTKSSWSCHDRRGSKGSKEKWWWWRNRRGTTLMEKQYVTFKSSFWIVFVFHNPNILSFRTAFFCSSPRTVLLSDMNSEKAVQGGLGGVRCAVGPANNVRKDVLSLLGWQFLCLSLSLALDVYTHIWKPDLIVVWYALIAILFDQSIT